MPRFVVLAHDWPAPHWDFLVEAGGVLRAWRLLAEPKADTEITAEPNADHRLLYLDHEGAVSGGRGSVVRWDAGCAEWAESEPDRVQVELRGVKLAGRATILRSAMGGWVFRITAVG
jgi:hypothetical protein